MRYVIAMALLLGLAAQAQAHGIELHKHDELKSPPNAASATLDKGAACTEASLRAIVREELAPLMQEMEELHDATERPGMTQIIGGIGYIVGLAGLAMWLKSRKG